MVRSRLTKGDRIFLIVDYILISFFICTTLYPFVFVISASISDPVSLGQGKVWLWPVGFNLSAYKRVVQDPAIWTGYMNTIWYVGFGTLLNLFLTTITAFPLSRKHFSGRNVIMMGIAFTMFFSGGMVPSYLLIRDLGLINSRLAVILPVAIATWNLIIMRTFFQDIPDSLYEAATIDGSNDLGILIRIFIPLSKPVIAVMILFYAVGHWNSWFFAMLYLNDTAKQPLQLVLRKILIQYDLNTTISDVMQGRDIVSQSIRYATIIVSTLPILTAYPFLQKYFVKGVMIGAIKG